MNHIAVTTEQANFFWPDNNVSQLLQQLERIDLILQAYVGQVRERGDEHVLEKFILTAEDIDARMNVPQGAPHWLAPPNLRANEALMLDVGRCDLLELLALRFDLTDFEKDMVLFGLLPYFDSRYFALFAALHEAPNKKSPTFELALTVFCSFPYERIVQEASFLSESPLLNCQLLSLGKKGEQQGEGWGQTSFQTDLGVYYYLTGRKHLPASLVGCTQWLSPDAHKSVPPPAVVAGLVAQLSVDEARPVMMLRGAMGSGRAMAITTAAQTLQRDTLQLDMAHLPDNNTDAQFLLTLVLREVRMHAACLVVCSLERLAEERQGLLATFARQLKQPGLQVVCLCPEQGAIVWLPEVQQVVVDMPLLKQAEKEALLRSRLGSLSSEIFDVKDLCRRQHFTAQTLPQILKEASLYRMLRDPSASLSEADLRKAFRLRSQQHFAKLARRIEPKRTFDDLIVGEELAGQLTEILIATKHRNFVLESGFGSKVGYGTGISALFYGDSGTGKTMAAEVVAGQLGVDLIQIDLATVVSKYIGETEKNLALIFDLAEADAGVLFFDEADALFGKRSAVKDAKDRHANIEVSYLLQRLESYPGLVILATNNRGHLDDAFSRRFTFITRFAFPDVSLRERMWRAIWPEKINLASDVDCQQLAQRAELTGANIRNIALLATWLAADEQTFCVLNRHIELALNRELAKVGRLQLNQGA